MTSLICPKFLRPEPFYIASRVEGAIALTTVTIAAMGKDDGEIQQILPFKP